MKRILITGVAGSGKSTACRELAASGYEAYGIEDIDGMFAMFRKGTKDIFTSFDNSPEKLKASEWMCDVEKLKSLIAEQKNDVAFYCGVASNMDDSLPLFDRTLLLRTDPSSLHARLLSREGSNDVGNTEESRQSVLGWKEWWENMIIEKGAHVIDARGTAKEVSELILRQAND